MFKILIAVSIFMFEFSLGNSLPDASKMISFFEKAVSKEKGARRNHVSGFCFTGEFAPNKKLIGQYSKSSLFTNNSQLFGRFSHKGGVKKKEMKPGHLGMALNIELPKDEVFMTSLNTLHFFPASNAKAFYLIMKYKATKDKALLKRIKKEYPELVRFKKYYKKNPLTLKGYENSQFNSINSFVLIDAMGARTHARWSFVPRDLTNMTSKKKNVSFYKILKKKLKTNPLKWDMFITIANHADKVNDPSIPWEGMHETINAGTLIVNSISKTGKCVNTNFDPLVLPSGIEASEDSVLKFRSPTYSISFGKRLQNK